MNPLKILLALALFLCTWGWCAVEAQNRNIPTDLKVACSWYWSDVKAVMNKNYNKDFNWNTDWDFHKGSGSDYVYVGIKKDKAAEDTLSLAQSQITDLKLLYTPNNASNWGEMPQREGFDYKLVKFEVGKKESTSERYNRNCYQGSLRGQYNYDEHVHLYISRSNNDDINQPIISSIRFDNSRGDEQKGEITLGNTNSNSTFKRYIIYKMHRHAGCSYMKIDASSHQVKCPGCHFNFVKDHEWDSENGYTKRIMNSQLHYSKCKLCDFYVEEKHNWYSPTATVREHTKVCIDCGFVSTEDENHTISTMPINDSIHALYCSKCAYISYVPHAYRPIDEKLDVIWRNCTSGEARQTCQICNYQAVFRLNGLGLGHDYDDNGRCRRNGCQDRYEKPEMEGDTYLIRNLAHLYWFAQQVNKGYTELNARLMNDIYTDGYLPDTWTPIGAGIERPYRGTFDGNGHYISGLQYMGDGTRSGITFLPLDASPEGDPGYDFHHLMDGSAISSWRCNASATDEFEVEFQASRPCKLVGYRITTGPEAFAKDQQRTPHYWTLAGSNDRREWSVISTVDNVGGKETPYEGATASQLFPIASPHTWLYYRFTFKGPVQGDKFEIGDISLEVNNATFRHFGLFGYLAEGSIVKDLTLSSVFFNLGADMGAIAGRNQGTIENCHVASAILRSSIADNYLGGICGVNLGTVSGCAVTKHVWVGSPLNYSGGICGTSTGTCKGNRSEAIHSQDVRDLLLEIGDQKENQNNQ